MAEPKKRNGNWHGTVYLGTDENGKRKYKSITTATKAEWYDAEREIKAKRVLGIIEKPKEEKTVEEVVAKYIDLHSLLSPSTLQGYEKIKRTTFPDLMRMKVGSLDNETVQMQINRESVRITRRGTPVSPKTIKNSWFLISTALEELCDVKFKVILPKQADKFHDIPSASLIYPIIRDSSIELPCLLAMRLSLSMSEIRGIKCTSFRKGMLYIERTMIDTKQGAVVKELGKAEKRIRCVPTPDFIMQLVEREETWKHFKETGEDDFLIKLNAEQIRLRFIRLMKKNGIEGVTFHTLRHIFASTGAYLNIPNIYIQAEGGWKTDFTMKKHYTQTFSSGRLEADAKLDGFFLDIIENANKNANIG